MDNVITFLLGMAAAGGLAALLALYQMQRDWPKSNDEVFRQRLQLPPRRRLLPRLRLPQLRFLW
jgi:hypothetical protein